MRDTLIHRRPVLGLMGAALAVLLTAAPSLAQQQAPMLEELVTAGSLPPLEERLPANPLVVTPVESVGTYGGTWHSALRGGLDKQAAILPLIGRLKITLLEVDAVPGSSPILVGKATMDVEPPIGPIPQRRSTGCSCP